MTTIYSKRFVSI